MKYFFTFLLIGIGCTMLSSQDLSSEMILNNSIKYHDPNGNWSTFKDTLFIGQTSPNRPDSERKIFIDRPAGIFTYTIGRKEGVVKCYLSADTCIFLWNDKASIPDSLINKYRLTETGAKFYRNYYLYLYGLPMKLKDKGTILHEAYEKVTFYGRESFRLKVTYEKGVGKDIWYFYFDTNTYALVAYQFFHDESRNDGEYILLEQEKTIQGIRMPQIRVWYTNDANKLLGIDSLR